MIQKITAILEVNALTSMTTLEVVPDLVLISHLNPGGI